MTGNLQINIGGVIWSVLFVKAFTQEQQHCKNTLCICVEMLFNPDFCFKTRNIMHFI